MVLLKLLLFPLAGIGWGLWTTLCLLLGIELDERDPIDREEEELDDQDGYEEDPDADVDGDTGAGPDAGPSGSTPPVTGAGGGQR